MPRRREKRPNTTLKRICAAVLHDVCFRFLYSNNEEFQVSRLILRATFGSILGLGVYILLLLPMNVDEEQKIRMIYVIPGLFAIGWAASSYFRCSTLVLAPNLLGKEGRTYIVIAAMASIYAGPVANIQQNFEEIARSVSCTVDQQINHTKMAWKEMTKPMRKIIQELLEVSKEFKNRSSDIKSQFKEVEEEVENTEGYSRTEEKEVENEEKIRSTQKKLELKTMLRCEYVVELGISKCKDWFAQKHSECMRVIWLPVINSLLCLPMKFTFVCDVMYLANRWCKNRLPLEANFGQNFDLVNETVYNLGKDFNSAIVVRKEEQNVLVGVNISKVSMTEEVFEYLKTMQVWMMRKTSYISTIMSCMFIYLFFSAYSYTKNYNENILYDNFYVTTYFRQIDARRRKLKKKHLLPLWRKEKGNFVFPCDFCVQKPENNILIMGILQSILFFILFIFVIGFDRILIHIFHIIRRHFQVSYVLSIDHKLQILVEGDSLLARLLQRTVRAFNSTSSTIELGNNDICLPNPSIMSFTNYVICSVPMVLLLSLCFIQVYSCRLRRVIASFFFPKREKKRVLHLYNNCMKKRRFYFTKIRLEVMRKSKSRQIWERTFLGKFHKSFRWTRRFCPWRCIVCNAKITKDSRRCYTPGCCSVYCNECWWDMDEKCLACIPYENYNMDGMDSDSEDISHID